MTCCMTYAVSVVTLVCVTEHAKFQVFHKVLHFVPAGKVSHECVEPDCVLPLSFVIPLLLSFFVPTD